MKARLGALFDVRTGEGRVVLLLALHSFLVGFSTSLFETAAESLFLSRWGADQIAFVYLGWAVAVPLGGLVYSKLQERYHLVKVWSATVLAIAAIDLTFALALQISDTKWIPFGMMVARDLFWTLMLMEFWDLAGWLLDLQQAKRLFGLVGGGEVAGGILAGVSVGPLLRIFELSHVILLTGIAYLACFVILRAVARNRTEGAGGDDDEGGEAGDLRSLFKVRYVALVLLVPVAYTLAYDFLEYAYLGQTEARYRDDPEAMAAFLGAVLACWQTLALIGRTVVSGRVLTRFGLWTALFLLPGILVAGGLALFTLSLLTPDAALLFWPLIGLKVVDAVLRNAIDKPSFLVLFQVLSQELRVRVHAFQESVSEPLTAGLSGVVLLAATQLLGGEAMTAKVGGVAGLLVLFAGGWLALVWAIRPEYDGMLARALTRHTLLGSRTLVPERSMIEGLHARLASADAAEVCYALEALRPLLDPAALARDLEQLLSHVDPSVRREAARHAEELAMDSLRPALEARLKEEEVPEVFGAVLRAYAAVGGEAVVETLEPYLEHTEDDVRRGALVGLLQHGGIAGVLAAGETILGLVGSKIVSDRILAADILGDVAIRDFHHPLAQLLDDPDRHVRRAAVTAAARVKSPRLVPKLITLLSDPALAARIVRALAATGAHALDAIDGALSSSSTAPAVRLRLAGALGRLDGEGAAELLLRHLDDPLPELRREVHHALEHHARALAPIHAASLLAQLEREAGCLVELAAARRDLEGWAEASEVVRALEEQARGQVEMAFSLLILLHPGSSLGLARESLDDPSRRAYALEIVDRTASRDEKRFVLPMFESLDAARELAALEKLGPVRRMARAERLAELIAGDKPWIATWTRVTALYAARALALPDLAPSIEAALDAPDPIVRETAHAALAALDRGQSAQI